MPCYNIAPYKRLQRVLLCPCNYTAHATKQRTLLYRRFSDDCTRSTARKYQPDTSGYNAACATLERITAPGRNPAHTRYHRHAGRCTGQHSRPIIIRYIRAQGCATVMDPCQTVQHIADHASPAGSASPPIQGQPDGLQSGTGQQSTRAGTLAPSTRRGSPAIGSGGQRGTIGGSCRISFRAFAR